MIYAIIALMGVIIGLAAGWLVGKGSVLPKIGALEAEKARLEAERQGALLRSQEQAEVMKRQIEQSEALRREEFEKSRLDAEHNDRLWQQRFDALKTELGRIQAQALAERQNSLSEQNSRQMGEILEPVRRQFEEFGRLTRESHTASEVGRRELQGAFETAMKLFQQQQQQAVAQIREQSERIGNDAASLSRALRGDTRAQGRWGEMVLEHILEESGLRRDHEFRLQSSRAAEDGRQLRPDVVVCLPDERSVIIDSKVSLTSYAAAVDVQDTDPTQAEKLLTDHARSVRRHIDELALKDYASTEKGSIEMVMMFMPTDSSYMAAIRCQPDIVEYAFRKRVAIITPSNLMMTLKLVYHLWQHDRQERNVEKIVQRGNELYARMAGFMEAFADINNGLGKLQKSYELAEKRLTGRGGIVSQFEMLKKLGLTPKKQIPGAEQALLEQEADDPVNIESPETVSE